MNTLTGAELIANERYEQLTKHSRTVKTDNNQNAEYQLKDAAFALLKTTEKARILSCPNGWNTDKWKRMCLKQYPDRLIISGALIAAELDRLMYDTLETKMCVGLAKLDENYEAIKDELNAASDVSPDMMQKLRVLRDLCAESLTKGY